MPHRIAIATEGPSDQVILETICQRAGFAAMASYAGGKSALLRSFDRMLRVLQVTFQPTHFLVVVDLHPEQDCPDEARIWRKEIKSRFPAARLCLCVWELEAWLLADPRAIAQELDNPNFNHVNPDRVGNPAPSEILDEVYLDRFGYHGGAMYHKESDGNKLAKRIDLQVAAQASPSLGHFMRAIRMTQAKLGQ